MKLSFIFSIIFTIALFIGSKIADLAEKKMGVNLGAQKTKLMFIYGTIIFIPASIIAIIITCFKGV